MNKISVAIAGVGNCASSLVQELEYDKRRHGGANSSRWIKPYGANRLNMPIEPRIEL